MSECFKHHGGNITTIIDMYYIINIYASDKFQGELSLKGMILDTDINEVFIKEIMSFPKEDIITIQANGYISCEALKTLDKLFQLRPDVQFKVSGWSDLNNFNGWDLSFLSLIPSVTNLSIGGFTALNTDFSVLCELKNLRSLEIGVYEVKDYAFIKTLPSNLETLKVEAEMRSGKPNLDCNWILHYQSLHTLFLGKIDRNLDCIVDLPNLKKLTLKGGGRKDLSFLKKLQLEDLEISWCNASKVDWNTLKNISSLQSLTLFSIKKLEDLSFISTLSNIEKLRLIWMGAVTQLPDLSTLKKLRVIECETCNKLADISTLYNIPSLEKVLIIGNSLTKESVEKLMKVPTIKELRCGGNKLSHIVVRAVDSF